MNPPETPSPFTNTISRWFFAALIIFILYLAYRLMEPFLLPLFLSMVLAVVGAPLYTWLHAGLGRRWAASALACLILGIMIVVPFFLIAGVITTQALDLYNTISREIMSEELHNSLSDGLGRLSPYLEDINRNLGISKADILERVGDAVRMISSLLYNNLTEILKGVTNLLIDFAMIMFITFYLFMDGPRLADRILELSPLPSETNSRVMDTMLSSIRTTLKGSLLLAIFHGLAGGTGFYMFGVPNAPFWGTVMLFASVVPLVGTALVWVPAGIYMLVLGQNVEGIGVMIWCGLALLILDNLVRPRMVGGSSLHPLLTFFAVLGGIVTFGLVGLILGPLVLALLLALLEIYQRFVLHDSCAVVLETGGPEAPEKGGSQPTSEESKT